METSWQRLKTLLENHHKDILKREASGRGDFIYLYDTGDYWVAFEQSAFMLGKVIAVSTDVVSVEMRHKQIIHLAGRLYRTEMIYIVGYHLSCRYVIGRLGWKRLRSLNTEFQQGPGRIYKESGAVRQYLIGAFAACSVDEMDIELSGFP